ncbi:MAG: GGDEF domain-containing protein [Deltaproteobacteria bacterium]|nr:GGDEF domain-containing protein [Deltaproteobacteria bacterium]MBN2673932.1 GGDEF domain-containing protein [Deltaproteobacteria bacterium]
MVEQTDTKSMKIGVLIDCLHESYQSTIWSGIETRAREMNIQLVSYVATSQDRTSHFHVHYNIIADFVSNSDIDGLIAFSGPISEHHGVEFASNYLQHFAHIPTVCISAPIGEFPCVVVDNQQGIIDLIDHFVQLHNLNNVAFVSGPAGHSEADERLEAYKKGLENNHLPFRKELVFAGDFSKGCGNRAVRHFMEHDISFDAVLCVNDKAAFGVIEELKKLKRHIPTEVAVTGFDDVTEASLSLPALTTVRQPLKEMGARALENVIRLIQKAPFEHFTKLAAIPVYRRSCGCFTDVIRASAAGPRQTTRFSKHEIIDMITQNARVFFDSTHPSYPGDKKVRQYFTDLLDSLVWDVNKASIREIFLNEVDMLLFKFEECADNVGLMNSLVTDITGFLPSLFTKSGQLATGTAILQQAHTLIREHRLNSAQTSFLQDTLFQLMIRETSQSMITTFEQRKLLQAISSSFPQLNINSLVFAVYEKRRDEAPLTTDNWHFPEMSRLLLGYDKKRDVLNYPRGNKKFLSKDLFPPDMYEDESSGSFVFMPLFFEDEHLGYAIFEYTSGIPLFMYEELRLHMSSALKSSFLMKELRIQSMLDELTGLHNRRGFMMEGTRMFRMRKKGEQRIMMFYADMDDLKVINDNYGHEEGDVAISGAASVLRQTFREEDLVARIGGDEFIAMLVWDNSTSNLEARIMDRLRVSLNAYNQIMEKPYDLSISMGVTSTGLHDNRSLEDLMREADDRLMAKKREKKKGRTTPLPPAPTA